MSNTLINSNGYVQSQNIKVFPCAYRGYYEAPTGSTDPVYKIINPEARTTSEYSFVNSYHKLSATKESYVISWTPPSTAGASNGVLKFVIGGYYFEITNCTLEDFITTENNNTVSKTFYINIKNNGNLPGQYLGSFESDVRWLDEDTGTENKLEDFYFTGLKISTSNISSEASRVYSLTPFASQYQHWRTATSANLEEVLSDIKNLTTAEQSLIYYTDEETNNYSAYSSLLEPTAASFTGTVLFYKQVFDINPAALPITNLLDSGSGKYSLRMLEDTENGINNTTTASGDYSVALGKKTTASGLISTALGNETTASGEASLATGTITKAIGINSVATGSKTEAQGNNSFTTGNETQALEDNSFAGGQNTIANGINSFAFGENTIATGRNAISVGYKALNTLNVGAYGQNSITAGTDTKTTTSADNAIAVGNATEAAGSDSLATGNSCKATGNNSFAGGISSEANANNSFAFGNNVKTNAENQVVFGTYNNEDDDQAFIIANGTSTTKSNKFTVSYNGDVKALGAATIEGATTINNSLTTKGNIVSNKANTNGDAANNLILGSAAENNSGTITVYGNAIDTKVFEVTNAGNTTITGPINFTNTTDYSTTTAGETTTYNAALKVAGGVHIGGKLNVNNNTTLGGTLTTTGNTILGVNSSTNIVNIKTNPTGNDVNVKITGSTQITSTTTINGAVGITKDTESNSKNTGALIVTGGAGVGKNLNVGKNAEITGTLKVSEGVTFTNDTDYTYTNNTHSAALKVTGGVHIGKKLNVANNATIGGSLSTASNTSIGGTLGVSGVTTLSDDLSIAGNLITTTATDTYVKFNGGITDSEAYLQVNGKADIADDLTLRKDLFVKGNLKLSDSSNTFEILDANDSPVVQLATTEAILPGTTIKGNLDLEGVLIASDTTSKHQIGSIEITGGAVTGVSALTASGTITANIFNATYVNTSSDRRLKQNIENYKCAKSILDLPIKKYEYISDPTKTQIGCIAQDLQEICPELVSENENGYLSIQENKLVYLLLQEVKNLKERIEELERR